MPATLKNLIAKFFAKPEVGTVAGQLTEAERTWLAGVLSQDGR